MRQQLKTINGQRQTFTGVVERLGYKNDFGHTKLTLLLKDVKDSEGNIVTDHLWFNLTKGFNKLGLQSGNAVRFDARVKEYSKGYMGFREDVFDKPIQKDYKLSHPTKIKKLH
jgi:hypothetical protein